MDRAGMASHVLHFLQYGAPAKPIAELNAECTAPFLPSLTLAVADSPALIPHLLPSLYSHTQVPRALAYANLDYVEIAQLVLEAEAAGSTKDKPGSFLPEEDVEDDENKKKVWRWDAHELEDDDADECHAFEVADEKDRVKISILSVRQRAQRFSYKGVSQLQEKDEGSIWSNDAYLLELLCLLPIAVSRCPALLTADQLVKGLLPASNGCAVLVTTFANNPAQAERGALALASILVRHRDGVDNQPGSPHASESTSGAKTGFGPGIAPLSREHSGVHSQDQALPSTSPYLQIVIRALCSFCHVSPSFAGICRGALVQTCTLPEMALQITLDTFQDELQFLSKLIFPRGRTSQWILSVFGSSQKHGESYHAPPPHPSQGKDKDVGSDHKTSSASQSTGKGVTQRVRDSLLADARSTWKKQGWSGRLHAHLRLYCVLIRTCDLQPAHEEVEFWLGVLGGAKESTSENTITNGDGYQPSDSQFVSERTLELGISFVCLIPGLSGSSTKPMLQKSVENLLRAAMGNAPYSACTQEIELAVWIAVQLLQRRFSDIAVFIREALGVQVTVHNGSMRDLADAAGGVVSDPYTAASAAAALRPRGPIPSPKKRPLYGLKCLEQLLHSTTFARCAVDISDTVMHYMSIAGEPIHATFPPMIQAYTELSVSVPRARGGLQRFRMRPLSRASLVSALAPGLAVLRDRKFSTRLSHSGRFSAILESHGETRKEGFMQADEIGNSLATTALVTYYILWRESIGRSLGIAGDVNHEGSSAEIDTSADGGWWLDLLHGLPLRELLIYMETNWPAYENLFPQWLGVASIVFPERFTAQALLRDLGKTNATFDTHVEDVPVTEDLQWVERLGTPCLKPEESEMNVGESGIDSQEPTNQASPMDVDSRKTEAVLSGPLDQGISQVSGSRDEKWPPETSEKGFTVEVVVARMKAAMVNPLPALRILRAFALRPHPGAIGGSAEQLEKLVGIGVEWPLEAAMMKELVPQLLDASCPRCLQDQFCIWWRSLPSSALERLVPVLLELLDVPSMTTRGNHPTRTHGKPSSGKAGHTVARLVTSGLVEEPLKLIACNSKVAASDAGRDGVKREEVAAAMIAQDSAVCQILLEGCLPNAELGDEERTGPLLEARCLILSTICSLIHRSPLLLKLLHFQGYDQTLVPIMVEGVPAMVQCLEFIGELIQQSQQQRQVFAAVLTAHLTSLHPNLPQSLTAAQQVVGHVTQVRSKVAGCARFLQEVLGSVAQIAATFPSLAPQVVALLQTCAQAGGALTRSGPPRDVGLHEAAVAAFKHLIRSKLLHGRPPPSLDLIASSPTVAAT